MSRILLAGDLETTGFSASKGDRIVEICLQMWDIDTRTKLRELSTRINPLRAIPEKASAVHGLYTEDLVDAPIWDKIAPVARMMMDKSDIFFAHNVDFDAPFLGEELLRVGHALPEIDLFCSMRNGRWATATGKLPKLSELAWTLGIPFDEKNAHSASYDTDIAVQCLWKGIDMGRYELPG